MEKEVHQISQNLGEKRKRSRSNKLGQVTLGKGSAQIQGWKTALPRITSTLSTAAGGSSAVSGFSRKQTSKHYFLHFFPGQAAQPHL